MQIRELLKSLPAPVRMNREKLKGAEMQWRPTVKVDTHLW